ncbi:MAG: hypothetical protein KatS3mg015_2509 [Fimbriimonadales bacterium]|nr:MAG: hypothetical protein KatS3mg015_2509 [Fimbriimonadales bacterium]
MTTCTVKLRLGRLVPNALFTRRSPHSTAERDLTDAIIETARLLGWRVAHFRPARTSRGWRTPVAGDGAGFPDLVLVGHGRILYREIKTERGRLRPEQTAWIAALREAGADAGVWTDEDWRLGAIESQLRAPSAAH